MPKNYKLFILFFLTINFVQAQNKQFFLKGKVVSNYDDLQGINVINLTTNYATITSDYDGNFEIKVAVGDSLLFRAVQFNDYKIKLKKEDFERKIFTVKLQTKIRQLDEVKINEFGNINSVSLGLVSKNQKKYTPAERKLRTAEELHWYSPLLIPLGGMSIDGLLNGISGRTLMLKKALVLERKGFVLEKINLWFDDKYFTEKLKIPTDYINGFKYYLVEDAKITAAINNKNKTLASFLMAEAATEYLTRLKSD